MNQSLSTIAADAENANIFKAFEDFEKYFCKEGALMQPKMTTEYTAETGAYAPENDIQEMFKLLTDDNKEKINLLIERLVAEQSSSQQ